MGTATFGDPGAPARVLAELRRSLARRGIASLDEVIGLAHRPIPEPVIDLPEGPDPLGDVELPTEEET